MTRQTDLISLIVEAAFMTHPEDEMLLLDDEFLDKLAAAVVAGINDFVAKQAPDFGGNIRKEMEKLVPKKAEAELFY